MSDLQLVNVDNASFADTNASFADTNIPFADELDYVFVHINKLDKFGKEIIKQNKDLVNLDTSRRPPQPCKYDSCLDNKNQLYGPTNSALISTLEKEGRRIYNKCPELRDLSTVMEHPEFYKFYLKYMNDPTRLKHMLVLMKMYTLIGRFLKEQDPTEESHNAYHKLVFLQKILAHPIYSRILLKHTLQKSINSKCSSAR
jgi:hypothetical protein